MQTSVHEENVHYAQYVVAAEGFCYHFCQNHYVCWKHSLYPGIIHKMCTELFWKVSGQSATGPLPTRSTAC